MKPVRVGLIGCGKVGSIHAAALRAIPEQLLAQFQAEDRAAFDAVDATVHYHTLQIRDFLRSIQEKRPPLVTGEGGRAVVELFTAIYQSSAEKRAVLL